MTTPVQRSFSTLKRTTRILKWMLSALFNSVLATILMMAALPLFAIISFAVKLQDDGPIFYRGTRLGFRKKPFKMIKFRTMKLNADKVIGSEMLSPRNVEHRQYLTPFGKFLRSTHLDELPQLIHLFTGKMDLVGPRPIRPEVYERYCRHISHFDDQFRVKPGLVGFSQLFIAHGVPKRIKFFMDQRYALKKQQFFSDIIFTLYALGVLCIKVIKRLGFLIWKYFIQDKLLNRLEKRYLDRISMKEARVLFASSDLEVVHFVNSSVIVNMNAESMLVRTNHNISQQEIRMKLEVSIPSRKKRVRQYSAICQGRVYRVRELREGPYSYEAVIQYIPVTALNDYKIQQYFVYDLVA